MKESATVRNISRIDSREFNERQFITHSHYWPQPIHPLPDQNYPFYMAFTTKRQGYHAQTPPTVVTHTHWLINVIEGKGSIRKPGETDIPVHSGQTVLLSSDRSKTDYFHEGTDYSYCLVIILKGRAVRSICDELLDSHGALFNLPFEHACLRPFAHLLDSTDTGKQPHPAPYLGQLAFDLLTALHRSIDPEQEHDGAQILARRAVRILQQQDCRITDLAEELQVSREHLSRCMQKTFGVTPTAYRRTLRMRQALTLLNSAFTLDTIARKIGFTGRSGFIAAFKKEFGCRPEDMRRPGTGRASTK